MSALTVATAFAPLLLLVAVAVAALHASTGRHRITRELRRWTRQHPPQRHRHGIEDTDPHLQIRLH